MISPSIHKLLSFVFDNPYSSFYKDKYQRLDFTREDVLNLENFEKLPFLTKYELERVSPNGRLFVDSRDVRFMAYTSGTTAGRPLAFYFGDVDRYHFEPSLGWNIQRPLIVYPPLNKNFGHTFIQQCRQAKRPVTPIFADFQNLPNSAVIANEARADAIYATPTIATLLAEHLAAHYDTGRIRLLALGSETLTPTKREELRALYPNAKIANLYASSEIGQFILYPCPTMIEEGRDAFHVLNEAVDHIEHINEELVVTYSLNKAMPLIRYRTGDYFKAERQPCSCSIPGPVFSWLGRLDVDRIRIAGTEMTVEGAEAAFSSIRHLAGDQYQVHFYGDRIGAREIVRMVVEILETYPLEAGHRDAVAAEIVRRLPDVWRISQSATLRDAIEKGLFALPEVVFVKEFSEKSDKTKRLVNHL